MNENVTKTARNATFRMAHVPVASLDSGIRLVKKPVETSALNVKLIPGNVQVVLMDFGALSVTQLAYQITVSLAVLHQVHVTNVKQTCGVTIARTSAIMTPVKTTHA